MDSEASIGETLRLRRESRGLSVEQAAFQGKVPLRLVHALESDDYRTVPDAFYLVRVLHDYARFLELDVDGLESAFRAAIQRHPRTVPTPSAPAPQISVSWRHLLWIVGGILVILPLVFIALSLSSRQELPTAPVPPSPAAPSEARVEAAASGPAAPDAGAGAVDGGGAPPSPISSDPATPSAAPTPPAASSTPGEAKEARRPTRFLLVAEARELTWMAIRSDDGDSRQVLLQAGEVARFLAERGFLLTVGNAGGVALSLNGTPLPRLGKSGEVVRNLSLPDAAGSATGAGTGR